MWVMTTGGFVSAVQHRDDASKVMVRARDRQSLATMVADIKEVDDSAIYTEAGSDYRWRVVVSKEQFKEFLAREVDGYLDYDNFKNRVSKTLGQRWHDAYLQVWVTMLRMVPDFGFRDVDDFSADDIGDEIEDMEDSMEDIYPEVAYSTLEVGDYVEIVKTNEFVGLAAGDRGIVRADDGSGFFLISKDDMIECDDSWMHIEDLRKI